MVSTPAAARPLILADKEHPFWGFAELLLIAALLLPAEIAGGLVVKSGAAYFHIDPDLGYPLLLAEFIGYGIIFAALRILFARHGRPLLESLAWIRQPFRPFSLILTGLVLSLAVILLGNLLRFPEIQTPMEELLADPVSRVAIAVFGTTLGPVVEELLFRGFVQPVLVDAAGVLPGILLTSALFGAMHLMQNAFIWQSGVLIALVGFVLGVIRHISGSTRASAITHVAYNSLPFLYLVFSGNPAAHK